MRTEVRNNQNIIIGYINDTGTEKIATHIRKGFAGRFVKSSNITFDKSGRIFCFGDGTDSLIRNMENN